MSLQQQTVSPSARRFIGGVDIHSHPLPGIDDGARTLDDSLMMLRLALRYGTVAMVATPHRYFHGGENTPDLLRGLTARVNQALAETTFGHRFELLVGQEIPLTLDTAEELQNGDVLTVADRGRFALVEPPFEHLPDWIADALAAIRRTGITPILAHPERNAVVQRDPDLVRFFVEAGAILQLTAMSVDGTNGPKALAAANWILDNELAGVVASDTHSPTRWRPPTMRAAYHAIVQRGGIEQARRLCVENPRRIIAP